MGREGLRWPLGAALSLFGLGTLLLSFAFSGQPAARLTSTDEPVNAGARRPGNIEANNSATLVRNSVRSSELAVVNRIDSPNYGCGLHVSQDKGSSWSDVRIPIPPGEEPKCFAPDAAFDADGTLVVAYVTLRGGGNVPHAAWIVRSRDGGRTLSAPTRVLGPLSFQVRLAADPARRGRIWLTWLQASGVGLLRYTQPGNPIEVRRSDDGGRTWATAARVSSPTRKRVVAPSPMVGRHGELYVAYLDLRDDSLDYEGAHEGRGGPPWPGRFALVVGRSADGSAWQESVADGAVVPTSRFIVFLPVFPSIALDRRNGTVYVAYQDARLGRSDVYVRSLPGGRSAWSPAVRVNDTGPRDGTMQGMPKAAVAPNGRLDVIYLDRRFDVRDRRAIISLQSSRDGGRTFSSHLQLTSRSFDAGIGSGAELGLPDFGSGLGLVAGARGSIAVWTDTRAGTEVSNKQDIALVHVGYSAPFRLSGALRIVLRVLGGLLLFAGVALFLGQSRRRGVET